MKQKHWTHTEIKHEIEKSRKSLGKALLMLVHEGDFLPGSQEYQNIRSIDMALATLEHSIMWSNEHDWFYEEHPELCD